MSIPRLFFCAEADGYQVSFGDEVISTDLDGGPSRRRRNFIGKPNLANLTIKLDGQGEFQYWMAFYTTTIARGTLPFQMEIIDDENGLRLATVRMNTQTHRLNGPRGNLYEVSFRAEVEVEVPDDTFNAALVDVITAYDGDIVAAQRALNLLEPLANVDLDAVG